MKSLILWGGLLWSFIINATEFLYPVAACKDGSFYLIYQKTPHHIELWEWDSYTKQAVPLLFSRFTPAGLRLLPSEQAFSFIDNGILKVKNILKRSPRIIDFDAPIYQVEVVHWIDDMVCYTSGKFQNYFGIFQLNYEGEVTPLCLKKGIDCIYPQKINDLLFYIERDDQFHYRVMETTYAPGNGDTFNKRLAWYCDHRQEFTEIASFATPVVFLYMISSQEGFVIGHPAIAQRTNPLILFDYYHLQKINEIWQVRKLFSFNIPSDLLFVGSPTRLYESILPLLPRHYGHKILFASANNSMKLSLCIYEGETNSLNILAQSEGLFPPVNGISGGELTGDIALSIAEKGGVYADLVEIDTVTSI